MKQIDLGKSGFQASEIVLGCMRIGNMNVQELSSYIDHALEEGITLFDHADIYGKGYCEELFGQVLASRPGLRDNIQIQSKCSIRDGYYDLSKEHILTSVDGMLRRLRTDYLDLLILHRPDTLMEPEEVAEAFDVLQASGKVHHFGVSNFNSMQIELLKSCVKQPLLVNQLQFSIMHSGMVNSGIQANTLFEGSIDRDGSILEYCRLKNITIQAWSPFQYGFFEGVFIDNDQFPELNRVLARMAEEKGVSKSAIAVAWILRHPAKMQTIVGTTNVERLKEICKASKAELTRAEWYEIYRAAGNRLP
ncbi:aldo/keto reductase family oxidoreductase [Anoxybacteroides tepidamans]|uniref:aldo/keto reductase n=1 Tax=Anoxybacteroides tepidamans TaxID=265948 RepID=UPI0004821203|nr:aldo/keto reductase [Anoxybacillus tepidamans]